jgi:antitoxin component of MazEF toxin-antitoxin module
MRMVMRVQRRGDEYCVVISQQALEAMKLVEGAEVELRPVSSTNGGTAVETLHRYATVEEGLDAFRRTEHLHRDTYKELAK